FNAFASDATDYKALVCVFLKGGMDNFETLIPFDQPSYNEYESLREPLLSRYDANQSRRRSQLLALNGDVSGRSFGFPREFAPLHELYENGNLAVIGNVGPLIEPIDKAAYENRSGHLPPNLFSHNDQQSVWMASQPEGARFGWGGRFAEIMHAATTNTHAAFTTVSTSGASVFLTGNSLKPFVVGRTQAANVQGLNRGPSLGLGSNSFYEIYESTLRDADVSRSSLFKRDMVSMMNSALDNNAIFNEQLALPGGPNTDFPASQLGGQLNLIAESIAMREALGMKRQIFFVSIGGFDTHSRQSEELPVLQAEVANAIGAFYQSLIELGLENSVTTFTASDFGRTLGVNGDGTDHGWGGHQLVVGGAVNGGRIYGDVPPAVLNHNHAAGRGRLIPTLSVDQYAASLGRWFGLSESDLADSLPGLQNFDSGALNGLLS
ncbi:MAG: DUF1501 domain-containing protein, partial [Pseudomonadota bacterium]